MTEKGDDVGIVERINRAIHEVILCIVRTLVAVVAITLIASILLLQMSPYILAVMAVLWLWNHW